MAEAKYVGKMVVKREVDTRPPVFESSTLRLGQFAESPDGRWKLKMFPNGNLEWGVYDMSVGDGGNDYEITYLRAWQSETAVSEAVAVNRAYYARFGPIGHPGYRGPLPPVRGHMRLAVYSHNSLLNSFNTRGGTELHLEDDGDLVIKSTSGRAIQYICRPPRIDDASFFDPTATTLIINTSGVEFDPNGHRTIHNIADKKIGCFNGTEYVSLEPNEATHISHPGQLAISMLVPSYEDLEDLRASAFPAGNSSSSNYHDHSSDAYIGFKIDAQNIKTIPSDQNYISLDDVPSFSVK